jgi:hypothetical protein
MAKHVVTCQLCQGRKRFWLGGRDYLECPDCGATGMIVIFEEVKKPPTRVFLVATRGA